MTARGMSEGRVKGGTAGSLEEGSGKQGQATEIVDREK